jgi:peptidoglycan/LPS O-acetylase OafA/YrhL
MMNLFTLVLDKKRIFGLDIIRALAIFFVVLGHGAHLLPETIKAFIFKLPFPDGVTVFFVLSGFLIGGILIKIVENEEPSVKVLFNFYTKRWLRTLPAYFLMLSLLIVLSSLFAQDFNIYNVINYFIFSQNFNTAHPKFFVEAWSLSVEEWFYLLIPVLIFLLVGAFNFKPQKAILVSIVSIITAAILFRYYRYLTLSVTNEEVWGAMFRGQVITRLDSLMFGVTGAYIYYYHTLKWIQYKKQTLVIGLVLIVLIGIIPQWFFPNSVFYFCNIFFIVSAISILLVLPYLSQLKSGSGILYKWVSYTSLISYSMYLTHASLIMIFVIPKISFLQTGQPLIIVARFILYWVLSYAVSILLFKYFEIPFMALRHKKLGNRMVTIK